MLKLLRKKGVAKKIIWIVAIVIIISFGFLGTAYLISDKSQANYAGKIFGKKVQFDEFNTIYNHVRIQAIMKYGDKFQEVQQYLNLENETWDRLILLHEVNKRKIKIPNEDVVRAIENIPLFQRNGQFDSLLYNDMIRFAFRIKPRDFEESMRDSLKFTRLFEQVTQDVTVDEGVIFDEYKHLNEKIQVSYLLFDPAQYTSEVVFDEANAKKYYEENRLAFISEPSINVQYLEFPLPEIPEEDSQDNLATIEDEQDSIRQKAELVYEDLMINDSFSAIAKEQGFDVKETGFFNEESTRFGTKWSLDVLSEIFKLPIDQIAGPFESNNALYIIKVIEKKDASIPTYAQAHEKIKDAYLLDQAKIIAHNKATEYLESIREKISSSPTADFASVAESLGLEAIQTPIFNRGQYLPKIGISKEFQEAAFDLTEANPISDVVLTEAGAFILHLDSYIPVSKEDYQKNRDQIAQTLLNEKRGRVFGDYLANLRTRAKLQNNIGRLRDQQTQE